MKYRLQDPVSCPQPDAAAALQCFGKFQAMFRPRSSKDLPGPVERQMSKKKSQASEGLQDVARFIRVSGVLIARKQSFP